MSGFTQSTRTVATILTQHSLNPKQSVVENKTVLSCTVKTTNNKAAKITTKMMGYHSSLAINAKESSRHQTGGSKLLSNMQPKFFLQHKPVIAERNKTIACPYTAPILGELCKTKVQGHPKCNEHFQSAMGGRQINLVRNLYFGALCLRYS
jgi:hypothetical protein